MGRSMARAGGFAKPGGNPWAEALLRRPPERATTETCRRRSHRGGRQARGVFQGLADTGLIRPLLSVAVVLLVCVTLSAIGIRRSDGKRMLLGVSCAPSEAETHWRTFIASSLPSTLNHRTPHLLKPT